MHLRDLNKKIYETDISNYDGRPRRHRTGNSGKGIEP